MMDQNLIETWGRKDAWTVEELASLCCGLDPDWNAVTGEKRTDADFKELIRAKGVVERAVNIGALASIRSPKLPKFPDDPDRENRIIAHMTTNGALPLVRPSDAIPWARRKFKKKFPAFTVERLPLDTKWPRDTELLRLMKAAAEEFWGDPDSPAPLKKEVKGWLQVQEVSKKTSDDRKVAERVAEVMARILCEDGALPPQEK